MVTNRYHSFLMSTTGVKRVGQGYQSDNVGGVPHPRPTLVKRNSRFFLSAKRAMPPPVSSEDLRRSAAMDEFGTPVENPSNSREDGSGAVSIVKRAIRAMTVKR